MDTILSYYKQELESLYREIKGFTDTHPTLGVGAAHNILDNPHVALLIESFSLLHANLNLKLEENFTGFISNLFNILYPHYNSPIPSIAIIAIKLNEKAKTLIYLPKGKILKLGGNNEESCNFQTCYETTLLPIEVIKASCIDVVNVTNIFTPNTKSLLSIHLSTLNKTEFNKLDINKLRFFIQGSQELKYAIFEAITDQVLAITINNPNNNDHCITVDKNCIAKVGFAEADNLFPYNPRSFIGYRVITEFFTFPDKFLFFDVDLVKCNNLPDFTNNMELRFHLSDTKLVNLISNHHFVLNAVPIINLFSVESDPISINYKNVEYPLIIDTKAPEIYEIYSIRQANLISKTTEKEGVALFDTDYRKNYHNPKLFWYSTIRKQLINKNIGKNSELYISIIDQDASFEEGDNKFCYIKAECFNSNLPYTLYSNGVTEFTFTDHTLPINRIDCLVKPSQAINLLRDESQKWEMIAHMSPNYLNIMNNTYGKDLIKQLLAIYDFNRSKINQLLIDSIIEVKVRESVRKIKIGNRYEFCKGMMIEVHFNEVPLPKGMILLFVGILEYFLAVYCSINSFVQLEVRDHKNNILYCGDPISGVKCTM